MVVRETVIEPLGSTCIFDNSVTLLTRRPGVSSVVKSMKLTHLRLIVPNLKIAPYNRLGGVNMGE